jgi:chromosome segregation ATPase
MALDDVDIRLRRLHREVEESAEALLELELDQNRELLERSALTGATAAAWSTASAAVAQAWATQPLLEAHVARLRDLRGTRGRLGRERLLELEDALSGPVRGEGGERRTAAELLARSRADAAAARELLAQVGGTWDALVPRLGTANATLRACAELLDELGAAAPNELAEARRRLAEVTDAVAKDPLSATEEQVAAIEAAVARVRAEAERVRDFRTGCERRLDEARVLLEEAHRAADDAEAAHGAARAKISGAELPSPVAPPAGLAAELDDAAALARAEAWGEAAAALQRWTARATAARDEALRIAAANRAPIAERDELRGRLGAYQAKAGRLRLLEDTGLAALHARAHRVLHTAPTDLGEAADLVRRYQEGLSGHEVLR